MFLMGESPETLMHVGSLLHFRYPEGEDEGFLRDLVADVRSAPVELPWTLASDPARDGNPDRRVEDDRFDVDYHVRHSALPAQGGERELGILVSRLHSTRSTSVARRGRRTSSRVPARVSSPSTRRSTTASSTATRDRILQRGLSEVPETAPTRTSSASPSRREPRRVPREPVGYVASILRSVSASVTATSPVARSIVGTRCGVARPRPAR